MRTDYIPTQEIEVSAGNGSWQVGPRKETIMNFARSFNNWRKYRQTCNELNRMSDRELNDLGIGRADISQVARKAVR